jgi:acylphosphatase
MESSPKEEAVSLRALVRGRVQAVGFRDFTLRRARELGVAGYVRNLSDGVTVEVVAEGQRIALDALLAALRLGPPLAYVEMVDASWGEATGQYKRFDWY